MCMKQTEKTFKFKQKNAQHSQDGIKNVERIFSKNPEQQCGKFFFIENNINSLRLKQTPYFYVNPKP